VFGNNESNGNIRALERRDFLVRWGRRFLWLTLASGIAFGGHRGYSVWRLQHLVRQTQEFAARGEFQSAVLVARRLLQLDENNLPACRAMAEMAEKSGSPDAVTWRRKIAQLTPGAVENQVALAKAALRFNQSDLAENVLESLPETAKQGVEYHQLAGANALAQQQNAKAETHFATALQIAPNDPRVALNLAVLRLVSTDPKQATGARATLESLAVQTAVRTDVLRVLTADALTHKDRAKAEKWATQLRAETAATFSDALLCFEALEGTEAAAPAFLQLQTKAADSAAAAAQLITWLNRHELARVAVYWSGTLKKEVVTTHPLPLAIAESYSFLQEWNALLDFVSGKNWGEQEAIRLAVESHALHRLTPAGRNSMEAQTTWRSALKSAQGRPEQLISIARLAEGWGYAAEAEEAWWAIANSNERARAALSVLQRIYNAKQDTRGLLRVAKRALELNPDDLIAANNCASLGLLVSSDSTSRRLALKLHTEHPANRAFAATYAYALHTEGKLADGLKVMQTLKEDELRYPTIAAYYVVMLVDNGLFDQARGYLLSAQRAVLLPEEQQLLTAASRKLG
jgi:tetratricopeptide (TPR) repeat protein